MFLHNGTALDKLYSIYLYNLGIVDRNSRVVTNLYLI